MAFVIRDLCALSVQQRCNFLYKSIYKTKRVNSRVLIVLVISSPLVTDVKEKLEVST